MSNPAVLHLHRICCHLPLLTSEFHQELSCGRGAAPYGRNGRRRGSTARGNSIIRHQTGIGQQGIDLLQRNAQFLRRRLGNFTSSTLPHLNLAAENGDTTIAPNMDPRGYRYIPSTPATATLRYCRLSVNGDQKSGAQYLDKAASTQAEIVRTGIILLVV